MIVFTVGVYDLMHVGHVKLFERAKALGDKLIVAVQSTDCILKYKPEAQIVNTQEERVYMVSSIKYVDEVIFYEDVDSIVQQVDFDIFVMGGDQVHDGFKRAEQWCRDNGKQVVRLPRTPNISSTEIRSLK